MGNSQKVKGYAQVEVRAMPKMCEKGYAQNPSGLNGNSQDVKGYAQVKVRAMPKRCERGYAQKQTRTKNITERTNYFLKGKQK